MDVPHLLDLLDLAERGADRFLGSTQPLPEHRTFGGLLLAQSIAAAGRTVPADRPVHSMHALFVRAADPTRPIEYAVDRIRDGGATSSRRVVAGQDGVEVFTALVSFQRGRDGLRHQADFPPATAPEELLPLHERFADSDVPIPDWWRLPRAIELRHVDRTPYPPPVEPGEASRHLVWMRAPEKLPDEPLLHACALAYASDMTLLEPVFLLHGVDRHATGVQLASLDHAMWFHEDLRADEWLLYDQDCPVAAGGRVLGRGNVFDRSGRHVATVAQEGLLRIQR
ncbi:acyl-CoA thioesterase II [Saccharopolyspora sp. WRP15-2]|uniref:Acyl-CoA thioesterase II n=1 Tax=Saccharopolyspora oryzae TaxID=2997343 RepID=A0ABT4V4L6_9PSEU|nr:acyl-CoA thioesterase II [Saccharopolyspora oryzae]MDA3628910.1 acyl-CoA thioesterase II [Saccharopolyspora oryzae]